MTTIPKFATLILGAPKLGKSEMAGSIADLPDVEQALVLATKPREARSWGYSRRDNVEVELVYDREWHPSNEKFVATAHHDLLTRIDALMEDDVYDAVVIDTLTDAVEHIEHAICGASGCGSIGDMHDSLGAYKTLKDRSRELVRNLLGLTFAPRPKHVVVVMHTQPPKEDPPKGDKRSADKIAAGIEYEGSMLPMMDGGYRRNIAGDFDVVLFSGMERKYNKEKKRTEPWYCVQISPDPDRHSGVSIGIVNADKVDNSFAALLEAIE